MFAFEQRFEVQAQRELDGFAGGTGGRNDDDPPGGRLSCEKGLRIGGEEVVAGYTHYCNIEKREAPCSGASHSAGRSTTPDDDTGARSSDTAAPRSPVAHSKTGGSGSNTDGRSDSNTAGRSRPVRRSSDLQNSTRRQPGFGPWRRRWQDRATARR